MRQGGGSWAGTWHPGATLTECGVPGTAQNALLAVKGKPRATVGRKVTGRDPWWMAMAGLPEATPMRPRGDRNRASRRLTAIELVIAVVLIGLLAGFALPGISHALAQVNLALLGVGAAVGRTRNRLPFRSSEL